MSDRMPKPDPALEAEFVAANERARAKRKKLYRKWAHNEKMRILKLGREAATHAAWARVAPEHAAEASIHGTEHDADEIIETLSKMPPSRGLDDGT